MTPFRPDIPPQVAEVVRVLHPDLKRSIQAAIRAIASDPECGVSLLRELDGLWEFRVRRFRIVYAIDYKAHTIRLIAVDHRWHIYEELTAWFRREDSRICP